MRFLLSEWYNPIIHPNNPDMQRRALITNQLQISLGLVMLVMGILGILFIFTNKWATTILLGVTLSLVIFSIFINRKGHLKAASSIICLVFLLLGMVIVFISGGLKSPEIIFLLPGLIIAGMTLGAAATWVYLAFCVVIALGMLLAVNAGFVFPLILPLPPEAIFINFCTCLVLITLPLTVTFNSLATALKQVSQNEQRYRSLLENIPAITYISKIAPGRPSDYISPQTFFLLGYSQDEFLTDPSLCTSLLLAEDRPAVESAIARTVGSKEPVRMEYRMRARDGNIVWIRDEAVRLIDPQSQSQMWLGVWTDITLRRQAEAKLSEMNATLEELVSQRTRQVEEAYKELETFSFSVSHDLRAPLRAMRSYSAILAAEFSEQLNDEGRGILAKVIRGGTEMNEKIDGLLALARVSNNPLNFIPINLSRMVEEVVGSLHDAEPNRLVDCQIQHGISLTGDPILMRTALENLLGNAWKYTSQTRQAHIVFSAEMQADEITCCICDNGAGFDMAHAGKLFGTFQRLHGKDEFPGHGIGLATVKKIIQRHNGRIWAQAEVGKGAAFYFMLPSLLNAEKNFD